MVSHIGFPPIYMPFGRESPRQERIRKLGARRRLIIEAGMRVAEARNKVSGDPDLNPVYDVLQRAVEDLHRALHLVDRDIEALRHQSK